MKNNLKFKDTVMISFLMVWSVCLGFGSAYAFDGEGVAKISPSVAQIGDYETIIIEFNVGENGIASGGKIVINMPNEDVRRGVPQSIDWSIPQIDNPLQEGYTTVSTTNNDVSLQVFIKERLAPDSPPSSTAYNYAILVRVSGGDLLEDDRITVVYGDKSDGGPGAKVQLIPQDIDFTISTDADGDGQYQDIDASPHLQVVGGPYERLRIVIPSLVEINEPFDLKVVITDSSGYRASGTSDLSVTFSSSDKEAILPSDYTFTVGDNSVHTFSDVSFVSSGLNTISAKIIGDEIEWVSNPAYVANFHLGYKIYWGDIHWHSKLSDGLRSPDEGYVFARDESCLDFTAMTDHEWMHPLVDDTWWFAKDRARHYYTPDKFVSFSAYEWSSPSKDLGGYGNKNVYYLTNDQPLFPNKNLVGYRYPPDTLWNKLEGRDAITIPHHPASSIPGETDWSFQDDEMQPLVEIASNHGVAEYYDLNYPNLAHHPVEGHFVRDALSMGHKLGIIASSDDHRTLPGYTNKLAAVLSPNLTKQAIFNALKTRNTYATTGGRIILVFLADGHLMGAEYQSDKSPNFKVLVVGTKSVKTVELIKYDSSGYKTIYTQSPLETKNLLDRMTRFDYTDSAFSEDSFYYVRVVQSGETQYNSSRAWSSPIWINHLSEK